MIRTGLVTTILALLLTPPATAQQAWRFRWQPGQVLTYRVEQLTTAAETLEGKRVETTTHLNLVKRWQVLAVDAAGVATVQKSVMAMRLQTRSPGGDVLVFDSAHPEQSQPQLREQLSKYIGQPLETLRINGAGKVVEVKECKHGTPSRFESDLPFVLALPDDGPREGQRWERAYDITLAAAGHWREVRRGPAVRLQGRGRRHGNRGRDDGLEDDAGERRRPDAALANAAGRRGRLRRTGGDPPQRPDAHREGADRPPGRGEQLPVPEHVHGGVRGRPLRFPWPGRPTPVS
jgi:hypothetical protein